MIRSALSWPTISRRRVIVGITWLSIPVSVACGMLRSSASLYRPGAFRGSDGVVVVGKRKEKHN